MSEKDQVIKGVFYPNNEVRIRRHGPGYKHEDECAIGVGLYIPGDSVKCVFVDPGEFAKAVNAAGIEGLTVTYVKPFELPVREGAVVDMTSRSGRTFRFVLSADGSWRATADRDSTYEHERLLVWMNNTDATPTIVSNGLGVD